MNNTFTFGVVGAGPTFGLSAQSLGGSFQMRMITNESKHSRELVHKSIFIVGQSATGKSFFLKNLIKDSVVAGSRVGILSSSGLIEYGVLVDTVNSMKTPESVKVYQIDGPLSLEGAQAIAAEVDVIVVDDGDAIVGQGENFHQLLDIWEGTLKIVTYQSLDSISKSPIYVESILDRFDKQVFFRNNKTFVTDFLLGDNLAGTLHHLERGAALLCK